MNLMKMVPVFIRTNKVIQFLPLTQLQTQNNNVEPEDLGLRNLFGEYNNSEINHPVPQDSNDEEDDKERKEATLRINEHNANTESTVNNENGLGVIASH